jgi:hypothetical protein
MVDEHGAEGGSGVEEGAVDDDGVDLGRGPPRLLQSILHRAKEDELGFGARERHRGLGRGLVHRVGEVRVVAQAALGDHLIVRREGGVVG